MSRPNFSRVKFFYHNVIYVICTSTPNHKSIVISNQASNPISTNNYKRLKNETKGFLIFNVISHVPRFLANFCDFHTLLHEHEVFIIYNISKPNHKSIVTFNPLRIEGGSRSNPISTNNYTRLKNETLKRFLIFNVTSHVPRFLIPNFCDFFHPLLPHKIFYHLHHLETESFNFLKIGRIRISTNNYTRMEQRRSRRFHLRVSSFFPHPPISALLLSH